MNYLTEILKFYDHIEQSQLSASAVSLWHGLLYTNNKVRWAEKFTASSASLNIWARLPLSTFKRARKELVDKGYLHYESRGTGQAPVYQMIPLSQIDYGMVDIAEAEEEVVPAANAKEESSADNMAGNVADKSEDNGNNHDQMHQGVDQDVAQGMDQSVSQGVSQQVAQSVGPLYKHKYDEIKPKRNNYRLSMDIRTFYNNHFIGEVTTQIRTSMEEQVGELGEPLVMEAMKRAVERNKLSWGYVNAICKAWKKKGITTLEQVHADEEAFQKHHAYQRASLGQKEVVPDWFKDRHKEAKPKKQVEEDELSSEEIGRMLAAISSKGKGAGDGMVPL
ncbi:DnaD domain-containing protein [Virgibacillus ainsalahensis]